MTALTLCETCRRHVRATESSCPFCGTGITAAAPARARTTKGASRAVLYALATATSVASLACESPRGPSVPTGGTADAGAAPTTSNTAPPVDTNDPPDRPPNMPYGCVFPDGACTGELV